jgi:hypothetical protein
MRKLAVAGILLASCTLAAAQDTSPADKSTSSGNWFTRTFSFGGQEETKKPAEKKKEPVAPVLSPTAIRAREEVILNRRLEVILKLRTIATTTNDGELQHQADELEERANGLFQERTAGLASMNQSRQTESAATGRAHRLGSVSANAGVAGDNR